MCDGFELARCHLVKRLHTETGGAGGRAAGDAIRRDLWSGATPIMRRRRGLRRVGGLASRGRSSASRSACSAADRRRTANGAITAAADRGLVVRRGEEHPGSVASAPGVSAARSAPSAATHASRTSGSCGARRPGASSRPMAAAVRQSMPCATISPSANAAASATSGARSSSSAMRVATMRGHGAMLRPEPARELRRRSTAAAAGDDASASRVGRRLQDGNARLGARHRAHQRGDAARRTAGDRVDDDEIGRGRRAARPAPTCRPSAAARARMAPRRRRAMQHGVGHTPTVRHGISARGAARSCMAWQSVSMVRTRRSRSSRGSWMSSRHPVRRRATASCWPGPIPSAPPSRARPDRAAARPRSYAALVTALGSVRRRRRRVGLRVPSGLRPVPSRRRRGRRAADHACTARRQYKANGDVYLLFVRERSNLNEWQYLWAKAVPRRQRHHADPAGVAVDERAAGRAAT